MSNVSVPARLQQIDLPLAMEALPDWAVMAQLTTENENEIVDLLRRNLTPFEEAGSVMAATFRRLQNLHEVYKQPGCQMIVIADRNSQRFIGVIGLGTMAGLPYSERIGEIRDLVVDPQARRQGLGSWLISAGLSLAHKFGYQQIYLETTPAMAQAQVIFRRFGFTPLLDRGQKDGGDTPESIPCYFTKIMKRLSEVPAPPKTNNASPG